MYNIEVPKYTYYINLTISVLRNINNNSTLWLQFKLKINIKIQILHLTNNIIFLTKSIVFKC